MDYLTSPVSQKVESWTHYNEWGEITHNAVLKMGLRELDLVKNYTGHDYDVVLNLYYAKARFYDAENRRFLSVDPILDGTEYDLTEYVYEVVNFTAYLYVRDNPLRWVDPLGLRIVDRDTTLTTLQDGGGTTAGLDSAAQSTSPNATTLPTNKNSASKSQNPNAPREQMYDKPSSGNNTPVPDDGPMEKVICPAQTESLPDGYLIAGYL